MGHYTNNHCAVCFHSLLRPQNTCGAPECLAEWKTWSAQRRFARKNLAHLSPTERALALQQGQTSEELEAQEAAREQLASDFQAHQARQVRQDSMRNAFDNFIQSGLTTKTPETLPPETLPDDAKNLEELELERKLNSKDANEVSEALTILEARGINTDILKPKGGS